MPEIEDHEHDGSVLPRRATKADYMHARMFRCGLPPACLLWQRGVRERVWPQRMRNRKLPS